MIQDFIVELYGETTYRTLAVFFSFYPIWLPLLSGWVFWELWVRYVRYLFFLKTQTVLIEVKIPRDIAKSPIAMEIILLSLYQTGGESNFIARYWDGKVRAWFSLEIVSVGGEVRFYIWTRKELRDLVEAQLYSQYPNIEITEVEDYARPMKFEPGVTDLWGAHYVFTQPDAYPIKTYIDYGLDKDPDEELKHDPLTAVLEFLGSLKPEEQVWLQFIVRAHKKEKRGGVFSPAEDWRKAAEAEIKKIQAAIKESGRTIPTQGEAEKISSIERSLGKFPFDVGIRALYLAPAGKITRTVTTGMRGLLRPFSSNNLNGFKNDQATEFDYPWQDFRDIRVNKKKRKMLDSYKRRMFFFYPYKFKPIVMTNEELATVFHFPGAVALTPGIPRIQSKRAQAPTNLPI